MIIESANIKNYKSLKSVAIKPESNLFIVGGPNGAGKTNLLESFLTCLGGKRMHTGDVIRDGTTGCEIDYDLGDLKINLKFHVSKGPKLTVTRHGEKVKAGQTLLNQLYHKQAFNPIEFLSLPTKEQVDIVKQIVGLDFTEKDTQREKIYNERTDLNKDIGKSKAYIEALDVDDDTPDQEVSISSLMSELKKRKSFNNKTEEINGKIEEIVKDHKRFQARINDKNSEIFELNKKIKKLEEDKEGYMSQMQEDVHTKKSLEEELLKRPWFNENEIEYKIENAEEFNKKVCAKKQKKNMLVELDQLNAQERNFTNQINDIDQWKADQIAQSKMPYPGLSFDGEELLLDKKSFSRECESKRRRVAVSMLFNLLEQKCGEHAIKVILLLNSPYTDESSREELEQIAIDHDGLIMLESGGEGEECHVIMADGNIKGENEPF